MGTSSAVMLHGWGRYPRSAAPIKTPQAVSGVLGCIEQHRTIARGLGRSYADQALNEGGHITQCTSLDRYLDFDPVTATLNCESGVSLAQIIQDFAPRGFFPMVTPGTKYVTIGGCIANDVHGKGHHVDGCFSRCVKSFRIALASGQIITASRETNPDLFWANFGGMGLLGIIIDAKIVLRRVQSTYFSQQSLVVRNLDEMMDLIEEHHSVPYALGWLDPLAKGDRLGRGVLKIGDHASAEELPASLKSNPLFVSGPPKLNLPFDLPNFALNGLTAPLLNMVLYQKMRRGPKFTHYEDFVYPLDFLPNWNRGYGSRGFTQYQFVLPEAAGKEAMREILTRIATSDQMPFLNVFKKLGPEEGLISFPMTGYTYAIDFPIKAGLDTLLRQLDEMVIAAKGRVYLGKDAFVSAEHLEQMYPRLDEWRSIKERYDPDTRFSSQLGRRVGLCS